MSENSFVGYVRDSLKSWAYVHKHNDLTEGVSDLSLCVRESKRTIWMELKVVDDPPKRASTKINWDHYTEQQALWLRQRGGWLFVRVFWASQPSYYLFTGAEAWAMWKAGGYDRRQFVLSAYREWNVRVAWLELREAIDETEK